MFLAGTGFEYLRAVDPTPVRDLQESPHLHAQVSPNCSYQEHGSGGTWWRLARNGDERPSPTGGRSVNRQTRALPGNGSAVLGEELHDVVEAKPSIAALAHAIERELAAIAQPLHRVDVQMKHVGNFGCGEHRSQFVYGHRCHVVCSLALHVISTVRVPVVLRGRVRPAVQRSV